jgi:hypothetical protein
MFKESHLKNGEKKDLHYVVKNTSFQIHYTLENMPIGTSFKNARVSCRLIYDLKSRKEVDFISNKPLEYVVIPNDNGQECVIEFRVKVLTTQLEGSHFLILTTFEQGKMHLEVDSASIKAVSKPAQIRRKIEEKEGKMEEKKERSVSSSSSSNKKRKRSGEVIDVVLDMQKVQDEHTEMLKQLHSIVTQRQLMYSYYPYNPYEAVSYTEALPAVSIQKGGVVPSVRNYSDLSNTVPNTMNTNMNTNTNIMNRTPPVNDVKNIKKEEVDPEVVFEEKMKELISLYAQLNPGHRANKLRKVMTNLEKSSPADVADFKGAIWPNTDPLVQNELNAFCMDYLQNGHSTLEY